MKVIKIENCFVNFDTYALSEASAANDSLLLRPNIVGGTRDIVTTECRRPDEVDACKYPNEKLKKKKMFYSIICSAVPECIEVPKTGMECETFCLNLHTH